MLKLIRLIFYKLMSKELRLSETVGNRDLVNDNGFCQRVQATRCKSRISLTRGLRKIQV